MTSIGPYNANGTPRSFPPIALHNLHGVIWVKLCKLRHFAQKWQQKSNSLPVGIAKLVRGPYNGHYQAERLPLAGF